MKALVQNKFGNPESVFSVVEMPMPKLEPEDVLVKTLFSPVHHHDISAAIGIYGQFRPFPIIGGSEAVGIVQAVGSAVKDFKKGQRVICMAAPGAWAEYFAISEKKIFPVSDELEDPQAAQLASMPVSALLLLNFLKVQKGDWIIQNGANGVVGKILAGLAQERGVHIINLVRSQQIAEELQKTGFEHAINMSENDWKEQVRGQAGDRLKAAIDVLGGKASGDLVELLGTGGQLVSFGKIASDHLEIPSGSLILKDITVKGFYVTPVLDRMSKDEKMAMIQELEAALLNGKLSLPVEKIYKLEAFKEAMAAHNREGRKGRVLFEL